MPSNNTRTSAGRTMPHIANVQRQPITEFARKTDLSVLNAHSVAREHNYCAATAQTKYYDRTARLKHYKSSELKVFLNEQGVGMDVDRPRCSYCVLSVICDAIFRVIRAGGYTSRGKPRSYYSLHQESRLMTKPECSNVRTYIAHLKATQPLKQT